MQVCMIGTGYVGLVSGACFAEFGHEVTCVDTDGDKIAALERGDIPIYEPGLEDVVTRNVAAGRLKFTSEARSCVGAADAVFIAVGTPARHGDGHADLAYVYAAVDGLAELLEGYTVIVTKSTVPVGTGAEIAARLAARAPHGDWDVASNPEFLREGAAVEDFMRPDRIIVGAESEPAQRVMRELYRPLYLNETPIVFTNRATAELTKYAANAFLATKIGFINEMADLCERVGADVQDVARGMGLDKRIGPKFLHPGPGFGGSCFPKDTRALLQTASEAETPQRIVEATVTGNDARKAAMADRVIAACGGTVAGKRIAVLGLTFKPNTDDMRESPALEIVPRLVEAGAEVCAYDPEGMENARALLPAITYCGDAYAAMDGADALVIVTEWNQFRALDFERMTSLMRCPVLIDLRNIYSRTSPEAAGLTYYGIGLAPRKAAAGGAE